MIQIRTNLAQFNAALRRYAELSGKTAADVITKQGGKLAWVLSRRLRGLAPQRNEIRAERLAALRRGEGILVRPSVRQAVMAQRRARSRLDTRKIIFGSGKGRASILSKEGKRVNLTAMMVRSEINFRERAKGFLSASIRYPRVLLRSDVAKARYGQYLSRALLAPRKDSLAFQWGPAQSPLSAKAAEGLLTPDGQREIAGALADATEDILIYVRRKLDENATKSGLTRVAGGMLYSP